MMQQFYPAVNHNFTYELHKDMNFSAAHYINNELAGQCQYIHGHTYFVDIMVAGNKLDEMNFLINFKDIKTAVHNRFDHTLINNHTNLDLGEAPSTEKMAQVIFDLVEDELFKLPHRPHCLQVIVRETPTSYVVYKNPNLRNLSNEVF